MSDEKISPDEQMLNEMRRAIATNERQVKQERRAIAYARESMPQAEQ